MDEKLDIILNELTETRKALTKLTDANKKLSSALKKEVLESDGLRRRMDDLNKTLDFHRAASNLQDVNLVETIYILERTLERVCAENKSLIRKIKVVSSEEN